MVHQSKLMVDYNLMINEKNFQTILDEVINSDDKVIVLYSALIFIVDCRSDMVKTCRL